MLKNFHRLAFAAALFGATPTLAAKAPMDCSKGTFWTGGPVQGFFNGKPFKLDEVRHDMVAPRKMGRVALSDYHIYLIDKTGPAFDVMVTVLRDAKPDGRTFIAGLNGTGPDASPGYKEIPTWQLTDKAKKFQVNYYAVRDASMQLVFGKPRGNVYPMSIHFCAPSKGTELVGTFTLNMN